MRLLAALLIAFKLDLQLNLYFNQFLNGSKQAIGFLYKNDKEYEGVN